MRRPYFVLAVFECITNAAVCFWEEIMEKKQKLRLFIVRLTAIMFAAYSAFYIFVIVRDFKYASLQKLLIDAVVSLLFALLSAFAWTSEVSDLKFIMVRWIVLIITLLAVVLLKLRLTGRVIAFLDFTGKYPFLYALYGAAFFMSLVALILLLVALIKLFVYYIYYTFIRRNMPLYPKVSVILPLSAMILFILSFVAEILLFVIYHFGLEDNMIRTVFSRPVFYLGFIGLSAYFLYPPRIEETAGYKPPDDSEFVKPADNSEYVPPEGSKRTMPDSSGFVTFEETKHKHPKGKKHVNIDDSDFVASGRAEYTPPKGSERTMPDSSGFVTFEETKHKHHKGKKHVNIDNSDFVIFDDSQHKPPKGTKHINVDDSDFIRSENTEYIPPGGTERKKPDDSGFITFGDGSFK